MHDVMLDLIIIIESRFCSLQFKHLVLCKLVQHIIKSGVVEAPFPNMNSEKLLHTKRSGEELEADATHLLPSSISSYFCCSKLWSYGR